MDFPGGWEVKVSACNAGDLGSTPGLGRSPVEGNGNLLQYSCLENPMDGGAWWATVHRVPKNRTWLSDFTFIFFSSMMSVPYYFLLCTRHYTKNDLHNYLKPRMKVPSTTQDLLLLLACRDYHKLRIMLEVPWKVNQSATQAAVTCEDSYTYGSHLPWDVVLWGLSLFWGGPTITS